MHLPAWVRSIRPANYGMRPGRSRHRISDAIFRKPFWQWICLFQPCKHVDIWPSNIFQSPQHVSGTHNYSNGHFTTQHTCRSRRRVVFELYRVPTLSNGTSVLLRLCAVIYIVCRSLNGLVLVWYGVFPSNLPWSLEVLYKWNLRHSFRSKGWINMS